MEIETIIVIMALSQVPWLLWAISHLISHLKAQERTETNIFTLAKRIRQLEDLVGKEDV